MKKQITRVSIAQTSKVAAALYFIMTLPFIILFFIFASAFGAPGVGKGALLAAPFIYAIVGFIFTAIFAFFYNLVAGMVGGVEFTTSEVA